MLKHSIINDLSNFCFNVSSYLYLLSKLDKLCFEKVYSIALSFNFFCLKTIFIFISAIAVFTIRKFMIISKMLYFKKKQEINIRERTGPRRWSR